MAMPKPVLKNGDIVKPNISDETEIIPHNIAKKIIKNNNKINTTIKIDNKKIKILLEDIEKRKLNE